MTDGLVSRSRGVRAVALAGGVAYNINANGRLIADGLIKSSRLFVQPAAGDTGAAWGAAMIVAQQVYGHDPCCRLRRVDFGPTYQDTQIVSALMACGLKAGDDYEELANDEEVVSCAATLLANNQAVGWFQGGSEFGPRALGFRSILLNASDPQANAKANRIKRREYWRPSAISIAAEYAEAFLEDLDGEAPFMNVLFRVRFPYRNKSHASTNGSRRSESAVLEAFASDWRFHWGACRCEYVVQSQ